MPEIDILLSNGTLKGDLTIPVKSKSIILFVHGSGSDRFSYRNKYVSQFFNKYGISTLLIDLLTQNEKTEDSVTKNYRYDVDFLTQRLILVSEWVIKNPLTRDLTIGFFSSSTGSVAALNASLRNTQIKTIISRGGRLDLIDNSILNAITIPLLLLVGSHDIPIVEINKTAYKKITHNNSKKLIVIPGASHFFDEPGKLKEISQISLEWFQSQLLGYTQEHTNKQKIKNGISFILKLKPKFAFQIKDRVTAGIVVSALLSKYKNKDNVSVVGVCKGGVIVANEIAKKLDKDFSIILSRKLRHPYNSEKAIGAIAEDGFLYLSQTAYELSKEYLKKEIYIQREKLRKKVLLYGLQDRQLNLTDKNILLIDDGTDTGSTLFSLVRSLKTINPSKIVVVTPIISKRAYSFLTKEVDKIVFLYCPKNFYSVEDYYIDFRQISDREILNIKNRN